MLWLIEKRWNGTGTETNYETIALTQTRAVGGLDKGGHDGHNEKWSGSRYISEIDPVC